MADVASPGLARIRLILWILVAVAAIGATALFLFRPPLAPTVGSANAFTLESTAGGTFSQRDFAGTPSLVFFGYTNCPNVCPTTLSDTAAWKEALGISDEQLRTVFVTVDPARDTMPILAEYLGAFDPDVIGLVGNDAQTAAVKTAFGAQSINETPREDGFYLVTHTALVFLVDRNGRFQGTIDYGEATSTALGKIRRLMSI